jgi:outer membrane protein OmpA-like peptidoglycan-associated protein
LPDRLARRTTVAKERVTPVRALVWAGVLSLVVLGPFGVGAQQALPSSPSPESLKPTTPTVSALVKGLLGHPQAGAAGGRSQAAPCDPNAPGCIVSRSAGGHPSVDLVLEFATGSDALSAQAIQVLDVLVQALSAPELAGSRIRIEGHTDTVGTRAMNHLLSERRAQSVTGYLIGRGRIDPGRLIAVGMGEDDLAVPTPDQTPEPRNRRVRIVNLSG